MKESVPKVSKTTSLDDALLAFRRAMMESLRAEEKRLGQPLSHIEALGLIAESGNLSLKDLAQKLRISPPSASALVDALIAKKLVTRTTPTGDRRSVCLGLASGAHRLFASLHKRKFSIFKKMLSKLSPADRETLARILITISH